MLLIFNGYTNYIYPFFCENKRVFCEIFYLKNFVKMCV